MLPTASTSANTHYEPPGETFTTQYFQIATASMISTSSSV